MIRPLTLFIGLRYTRAKRRNHFISFISLASMLGIALGVTVLITVLSVMNGFDYQIRTRFFAVAPQVTVLTSTSIQNNWPQLLKLVKKVPGVVQAAPYVSGKGMLINAGQIDGVEAIGIIPKQQRKISKLSHSIVAGSLNSLTPGSFHMVIGRTLANHLGLQLGDKVNLFTPQATTTLIGIFPKFRQFTITGIFHTTGGLGLDSSVAFINMRDAEALFPPGQGVSGLHIKLSDIYLANQVSQALQNLLPPQFAVSNWTIQFGAFFQALAMEKTILFIILLLIIAVAVFNLVSTLVMVVNDKRADIAILRTLGASPGMIMRTFIIQGAIVGLLGTILGLIGGLLLAYNATDIVNAIQNYFHVQFISSSVYIINYLPSRIEPFDIIRVTIIALALSLLATIYPAWLAAKTQPAEALRYE